MVYLDFSNAAEVWMGDTQASEVWFGNQKVWTMPVTAYSYFEGFDVDTGGWATISVGHNISRVTSPTFASSAGALYVNTTSNGTRTVGITLTGLTIGNTYNADAWVRRTGTSLNTILMGVTGIGAGSSITPTANTWAYLSYYGFTATATSHQLYVQYNVTNTSQDLYVDSVTVLEA